jgi:hypothetical protein
MRYVFGLTLRKAWEGQMVEVLLRFDDLGELRGTEIHFDSRSKVDEPVRKTDQAVATDQTARPRGVVLPFRRVPAEIHWWVEMHRGG